MNATTKRARPPGVKRKWQPCYHPRRQMSGTLTERDAVIFHDNNFEIFLDPDGEGRTRVGDQVDD
jgi:hypothetical protein